MLGQRIARLFVALEKIPTKAEKRKKENFISSPTATQVNSITYREHKIIVMLD